MLTCNKQVYDEILKQLGRTFSADTREVSKVSVELSIDPPELGAGLYRTFHWNVQVHLREIVGVENGARTFCSAGLDVVKVDKPVD